jgi:uncharacterized protein YdaU (DUF1376 family)
MSTPGRNALNPEEQLSDEDWLGRNDVVQFRFVDLHIGDWIGGTLGMNCEVEGAYIRFLIRLYQHGKPLIDDDREMSARMGLSLRVWKRLRDALVASGKIVARAGCLTNKRFENERLKRSVQLRKQAEAARSRWQKEKSSEEVSAEFAGSLDETSAKISANSDAKPKEINGLEHSQPMPPIPSTHSHSHKTTTLCARAPRSKEEIDDLQDKLIRAANGSLANPAACPGLMVLSEPIRWIEQGCNLDQDILPTISARSHKIPPNSVKSWSYFTQAVVEAKASREKPLPPATQPNRRVQVTSNPESWVGPNGVIRGRA